MQIKVPVIVVGCKLDLRDDQQPTLEQVMAPLMHEFREIETCIECSSIKQIQVLPCEAQQLFSDGFLDRVIVLFIFSPLYLLKKIKGWESAYIVLDW